jgi:hypothetical protein
MPWHPFEPANQYPVDEIVEVLNERLPKIKDQPAKSREIKLFEQHLGIKLIWTPFLKGWGRSPYNKNAWKRIDGTEFIPR